MDARRRLNTAARAKRLPVSQVRLRKGTVVPVCLGRHERHLPGWGGAKFTNSSNLRYVGANGEIKAPADLPETYPPLPIEQKCIWAP